ncbi:MAG: hypothetical protein R2783_01605 [Gelidibacter sp.]
MSSILACSGYRHNIKFVRNTLAGQTASNNGTFNWVAKGLRLNGGIRIVAVGSPDYAYNQKANEINTIFNSIR